ncbi:uncharacterized protein LOC143886077 [Tasmannia lanceolata]|uniref:uncharacterized protein LOC143886077 n=1 Tax=Tasmannia lanceolata TaxID=3420 RepID=UPI0040632C1C
MQLAQDRYKVYADRKRSDRSFQVGDMVYLRLQPHRQSSLKKKGAHKLQPRFYGPYQVASKVGSVAYRLDLPEGSRIHPVFHVSCLKGAIGQNIHPSLTLPPLDDEGKVVLNPEAILDMRQRRLRSRTITEYLVKW